MPASESGAIESEMARRLAAWLDEVTAYLDANPIRVELVPSEELTRLAVAHYNERGPADDERRWEPIYRDDDWDGEDDPFLSRDSAFIGRITANYVRHVLTNYDDLLKVLCPEFDDFPDFDHDDDEIEGAMSVMAMEGRQLVYGLIRNRVNEAILASYPSVDVVGDWPGGA